MIKLTRGTRARVYPLGRYISEKLRKTDRGERDTRSIITKGIYIEVHNAQAYHVLYSDLENKNGMFRFLNFSCKWSEIQRGKI